MPTIFSATDFMDEAASVAAQGQTSAASSIKTIDPAEFASTESLPDYANGLSPDFAINESPISIQDRLKMSFGNEAGKEKFLKQNYGEVSRTRNGDFVVKDKDGLWKRVSQDLSSSDPWEATKDIVSALGPLAGNPITAAADIAMNGFNPKGAGKELLSRAADQASTGLAIAPQLGLAAATGGASIPAQMAASGALGAGTKSIETILGRALGTYEASDEEMLQDIGIEGLMNIGGILISAGVKPAQGMVNAGLKRAGQMLGEAAPGSRNVLTNLFGLSLKNGARSVERLVDNTDDVVNWVRHADAGAASADDAINKLVMAGSDQVEQMAKQVQPALNSMYDRMKVDVLAKVDGNFKSNLRSVSQTLQEAYEKAGLAQRALDKDGNQFIKMNGKNELQALAQKNGTINPFLNDAKSLGLVSDLFDEVKVFEKAYEKQGVAGADQLMQFRKNLMDKTFELEQIADDQSLIPAKRFIAQLANTTEELVNAKFNLKTPVMDRFGKPTSNLYQSLNQTYAEQANQMRPLLRGIRNAQLQGSNAWQQLYDKVSGSSGRNLSTKSAFDGAAELLGKFGGKNGRAVAQNYENIKSINAASDFIPSIKKSLISTTAAAGAAYAFGSGNPEAAAPFAAAALVTSPRANYHVIKSFLKGRQFLESLKGPAMKRFLNEPQLVNMWASQIANNPAMSNQIKSQLLQQAGQHVMGGGGQR